MRILKNFEHAFRGLMLAFREQRNMKIHLVLMLAFLVIGFYLKFSYVDWAFAAITTGLVMGLEVMNTSIEELVNFISPEKRKEAKRIKDFAAGSVLIAALAAFIVGLIILLSKL